MTETNLVADREQFLFKSFEQLKLNDYLNEENDDSCLNLMKFTCSTPIKFKPNDDDYNYNNEKNSKDETNHNKELIDNQSIIFNHSLEIKKSTSHDYLFEKCDPSIHETTFKQESLIEFEQNEKLAQETINNLSNANTTKTSSPVNQLENLLNNLRTTTNTANLIDDVDNKSLNKSPNADALAKVIQLTPSSQITSSQIGNQTKKSDQLIALEKRLEHEIFRRQHCEKQIHELNENLLELQQELAVAKGLDRKKEIFIQNMEVSIQKILESWKQKELVNESNLSKAKFEKETFLNNETRFKMKIQLLEQELKKVGDDLVLEKVKSQEFNNEIVHLKLSFDDLKSTNSETTDELKLKKDELISLKNEVVELNSKITELKLNYDNLNSEKNVNEENFLSEIEILKNTNKSLNEKITEIKTNYENLIKEAKMVINESEKQCSLLAKEIEAEKLTKDSLQVEINVLEEKLTETVKMLKTDYESKIHKLQTSTQEKEKQLNESHKSELDQLQSKLKIDLEKQKTKHFNELQEKIKDYESKLTELNLQIDSHRNEIDRLKRANADLENDRNTIRQNLKQMLEVQMKEAMQLLGVDTTAPINSNNNLSNFNHQNVTNSNEITSNLNSSSFTSKTAITIPPKPSPLKYNYTLPSPPSTKEYETSINDLMNKFQMNSICKPISPQITANTKIETSLTHKSGKSLSSTSSTVSSSSKSSSSSDLISPSFQQQPLSMSSIPNAPIKDSFILNQIDLINQYYNIDNKTLLSNSNSKITKTSVIEPEKSLFASASAIGLTTTSATKSTTNLNSSTNGTSFYKSHENLNKTDTNLNDSKPSGRSGELRHFIEILLSRSPTAADNNTTSAPIQKPDYLSTINSMNESNLTNNNNNKKIIRSISSHNISSVVDMSRFSVPKPELNLAPKKSEHFFNTTNFTDDIDDTYNDLNNKTDLSELDKIRSNNNKLSLMSNFDLDDDDEDKEEDEEVNQRKMRYHDISDMEDTGYMKRESSEYYDDVKRTLNFDDDDESVIQTPRNDKKSQIKFLHSTSTPTLMKENNKLSLLVQDTELQNLNKDVLDKKKLCGTNTVNGSKSQPSSLKKMQSNSASTSQLQIQNQQQPSIKKISFKKLKSIKKSNQNTSSISSISSRSLSMISLGQPVQNLVISQNVQNSIDMSKQNKNGKPIWK